MYRTLWRWHFYAGLFCLPFVLTLALSGTVYLFKPQVDHWQEASYRNLPSDSAKASPDAQIRAALEHYPNSRFVHYRLPQSPNDAVAITVNHAGEAVRLYVNPFTLEIMHAVPVERAFMQLVKRFHGELLAGDVGSIVIELAGSWAIVLTVTGLYLWWPRNAKGLAGVLYPRLRRGQRLFWRDLHAVTGFWVAGFTLFLLISGLPWALVWGGALKELRQQGNQAHHQEAAPDWALRSNAAHTAHHTTLPSLSAALLQNAQDLNFAPPAELAPDGNRTGVWQLKSQTQNRPLRAEAWLDAKTGAVLETREFSDKKMLDRVIGIGIAAHEGQLFGWYNQALGVFTTTGLALMTISAFVLWRRRKPGCALGAPPPSQAALGKAVAVTLLALSLILPLLAVSLVMIWLVERLILRRLPRTRQWLGLAR